MGFLAKLMETHNDSGTDYNKFTLLSDNESADATIADYIVEQGTDGIWTYRKWNSGIAECWGFPKFASASMTNRSNSFYTTTVQTITFPTDLFINNPTVIAKAEMGNYLGDFAINRTNRTNTTGYIWCETSRTQDIWVHIHAIGRWK